MNYKGFKVEVDPKDLDKKNIVYYWLIKLNNNQQASYVGISTRTLQERTKEHLRKVKNPLEKYLQNNKENISSIKLEVVKEYKRNFKDVKKRLEKLESDFIKVDKNIKHKNLNVKTELRSA